MQQQYSTGPHWLGVVAVILWLTAHAAVGVAAAAEQKQAGAEAEQQDSVDYVSLAALLIRDGHYDRAKNALDNVAIDSGEIDKARYYTLRALIDLNLENHAAAKLDIAKAQAYGKDDLILYVYLAQAHYNLGEYARTLAALDEAGELAKTRPALYIMRAQAHWKMGDKRAAWKTLTAGEQQFPEKTRFLRRKFFILVDLTFYTAAAELGRNYLQRAEATLEDYLALGSALRQSGRPKNALHFLEAAVMRFPESEKARLELAHAYLDLNQKVVAANLFETAADQNAELVKDAAEVHRRAKLYFQALFLNAQINNQTEKFKQRMAILLELKHFEEIAAMEDTLHRVGLLSDDEIRYALAYAYFKTGNFEDAERHLAKLTSGEAFRKATAVRKAMEDCRNARWKCL